MLEVDVEEVLTVEVDEVLVVDVVELFVVEGGVVEVSVELVDVVEVLESDCEGDVDCDGDVGVDVDEDVEVGEELVVVDGGATGSLIFGAATPGAVFDRTTFLMD